MTVKIYADGPVSLAVRLDAVFMRWMSARNLRNIRWCAAITALSYALVFAALGAVISTLTIILE